MRIRSPRRSGALEGNRENIGRLAGDFAEPTSFDRRRLCSRMELPGARGSESRAEITRRILSSERCNTSSGPCCKSCGPFSDATRPRAFHGASFALGLGPLDHVDMPAVDALKQEDRGESVVEPGHLPGELHARRATTTDQPRLWLVIHVWIIGVRDETGNIVPRVSVGATSVVGDRARVRRFRRIRSLRISGRPAQTAAALAGACGQAASHPRIGGTGVPSPGLSEQACLATSAGSISAHAARQANTAASRAEKLVLGSAPLASHSSETGRRRHRPLSTPTAASGLCLTEES